MAADDIRIDPTTGAITYASGSSTGRTPDDIRVDPNTHAITYATGGQGGNNPATAFDPAEAAISGESTNPGIFAGFHGPPFNPSAGYVGGQTYDGNGNPISLAEFNAGVVNGAGGGLGGLGGAAAGGQAAPAARRFGMGSGPFTHDEWAAWRQRAGDATKGINRMPFVFSDYSSLPGMTDEEIKKKFYQDPWSWLGRMLGGTSDPNAAINALLAGGVGTSGPALLGGLARSGADLSSLNNSGGTFSFQPAAAPQSPMMRSEQSLIDQFGSDPFAGKRGGG